jgi:ABC-type lipoprotein release transport system permease subunit
MIQRIKIGWFLAYRQVRRASKWTTFLIIAVMVLTFLNLVVVSGLLVGLIEGSVEANKEFYTSDVIISKLEKKDYIEQSPLVLDIIKSLPEIEKYSARYIDSGRVEANYKQASKEEEIDSVGGTFAGIDPIAEDELTNISRFVIEGQYLNPTDNDQILLGANFLKKYFPIESPGFSTLDNVEVGDKVRIKIGDITREVTVKGIIKSKVDELSYRIFFPEAQLRGLIGRTDYNVDEISIKLVEGASPILVKEALIRSGVGEYARVQTFEDAQPKFLKDIKATFALLGNAIGSIGLAVASITIFIVIFINAITRRKFIGIMKGIGIDGKVIETSYIFQSVFYAVCGSAIGIVIVYFFLVPLFRAYPINFPFSDGILVAPIGSTLIKIGLLMFTTIVAGYIPARMIVRKNTLDAILGRN